VRLTLVALLAAVSILVVPAVAPEGVVLPQAPDRAFVLVMQGATFNGLSYPDTPLLEASVGQVVQFAIVVPAVAEPHTFHLHGHPWDVPGQTIDTVLLEPGDTHLFTVVAGGPDGESGDWMYHCHFADHMAAGMWGIFRVYPYEVLAAQRAPGALDVKLDRMGEPVDDATFTATLDGAPTGVHAVHTGPGEWTVHAPPGTGVLALTARSAAWGESVARVGLGGVPVPQPTLRSEAPSGSAPLSGHVHG